MRTWDVNGPNDGSSATFIQYLMTQGQQPYFTVSLPTGPFECQALNPPLPNISDCGQIFTLHQIRPWLNSTDALVTNLASTCTKNIIGIVNRTYNINGSSCGNNSFATNSNVHTINIVDTTAPTIIAPDYNYSSCVVPTNLNIQIVDCWIGGSLPYSVIDNWVMLSPNMPIDNTCSEGIVKKLVRTITATDNCGNTATAVQNIIILDKTPPTFTLLSTCSNATDYCDCPPTHVLDDCGMSSTPSGYSYNTINGTTNTWNVQDYCGNLASASQTLT